MNQSEDYIPMGKARSLFPYAVSPDAIRRLAHSGKVRTVRHAGMHPRYSKVDILRLVGVGKKSTRSQPPPRSAPLMLADAGWSTDTIRDFVHEGRSNFTNSEICGDVFQLVGDAIAEADLTEQEQTRCYAALDVIVSAALTDPLPSDPDATGDVASR